MSHVKNSRLVEYSFGAESLFKLFNILCKWLICASSESRVLLDNSGASMEIPIQHDEPIS